MELFNLSNLAIGGLVAALVAGWNHVRAIFTYVSSVLVIRAMIDVHLGTPAVTFFKTRWRRLEFAQFNYATLNLKFKDGLWRRVPFHALLTLNIFVRRHNGRLEVAVLNLGHPCAITTFRGLGKPDLWVKDIVTLVNNASQTQVERFRVFIRMGEEKSMSLGLSNASPRNSRSDNSSDIAAPISETSSLGWPVERIDKSFMFDDGLIDYHTHKDDPLKGLFYEDDVLAHLEDAKTWLSREQWYADRSIPWRRGILVHGPGGTGKSSLGLATAKYMNVPLYSFMLSTMSDQEFVREWQNLDTPCVVLFEDFDTVFDGRTPLTEHKTLTFDCVLNQISGVKNLNGIFLMVTTNHLDKIDPAMGVVADGKGTISSRPGRIDNVLYLGNTSESVRRKMVSHVLADWPEEHEALVQQGDGMTPAQFTELCIQTAFNKMQ